ncbi:hypothetical protein O7626_27165 [Micromonospora sp. WMMD1102]|uniref:hypothetical protein n=1 Tax=Micromonospora sp. WMMD1102 TaxID=3016105 RepID=UPI00241576D4|nr:hypothetical protein [Micromonospora sp. WMMD1102]MDG4789559.1 hypothetical protein [Micromonospora sp. WMMD1102]
MLNLSRARAATAGSTHPLPARALRHWTAALELADRAQRWLSGGVAELRRLPGAAPIGCLEDVVTALGAATDGVRVSIVGLIELRQRIDTCTAEPTHAALPVTALADLRQGAGVIDELTARMQQGSAALSTYAIAVSGVDPTPGRTARTVALAQATWYPPDSVGFGARLAGRLVGAAGRRPHDPPAPEHLRVPSWRRVAWHAGRGFRASGGVRLLRPCTDAAFFDDCLRSMLLLTQGNPIWYADRLDLYRRAQVLDGYADALAAAVVVAVDRRLIPGRDRRTVRRLAARMHARYDGGSGEVPPEVVIELIRAALGEAPPPVVDPVRLTLLQTLLLVDLLGDERLTRSDRAAFRAEVVELALTAGPARLTAEPIDRDRDCDG